MPKNKRVFYAFPGEPKGLSETVDNAIRTINDNTRIRRDRVRVIPWTDLNIGGKSLVASILQNIDRADVFACDLTNPNHNVLV